MGLCCRPLRVLVRRRWVVARCLLRRRVRCLRLLQVLLAPLGYYLWVAAVVAVAGWAATFR
ncbi:hypothetical protein AWB98_26630 [Mycolicibacterium conceptionense]|uniref:Uncharacterized protein n=1 Tax=Mycolicibacterium conceptionense TaxID=451644 RepID=A0ABX3V1H3_9MYCO|nr:hypothetical protein AWB98_26630 [Mycolicibacterium conceptionense]